MVGLLLVSNDRTYLRTLGDGLQKALDKHSKTLVFCLNIATLSSSGQKMRFFVFVVPFDLRDAVRWEVSIEFQRCSMILRRQILFCPL